DRPRQAAPLIPPLLLHKQKLGRGDERHGSGAPHRLTTGKARQDTPPERGFESLRTALRKIRLGAAAATAVAERRRRAAAPPGSAAARRRRHGRRRGRTAPHYRTPAPR